MYRITSGDYSESEMVGHSFDYISLLELAKDEVQGIEPFKKFKPIDSIKTITKFRELNIEKLLHPPSYIMIVSLPLNSIWN